MINKAIRVITAFWQESLKRLPYIFVVLGVIFIYQFVQLNMQTAEGVRLAKKTSEGNQILLKKITGLSRDNKELSKQNKALSEQNNTLAEQNDRHIDCVAKLFATYTQNLKPVILTDLDVCSISNANTNSEQGSTTPNTNENDSAPTPAPTPTQPSVDSQSVKPQPEPAQCFINIFGLQLFC